MNQKVTPDSLKSKTVIGPDGEKVGTVKQVVRETYKKLTADFIEIELDKKMPWGPRDVVKVRTRDATLQKDGTLKVKYNKEQLKVMLKEQELQKHPPTI